MSMLDKVIVDYVLDCAKRLTARNVIGDLMHHKGSIDVVLYVSASFTNVYIIPPPGQDRSLCQFRERNLVVGRALKGFKGCVDLPADPSDQWSRENRRARKAKTLPMWNLMRGKGFTVRRTVLQFQNTIHVFASQTRIGVKNNGAGELLLISAEDKKLSIATVRSATLRFS
ncbi:hypothetical protein DFH29DRAFT_876355 [Suillus ampliporus]|nr:hypothetical protein DFH29DRAFT_876355 [Suillus ampliporus]